MTVSLTKQKIPVGKDENMSVYPLEAEDNFKSSYWAGTIFVMQFTVQVQGSETLSVFKSWLKTFLLIKLTISVGTVLCQALLLEAQSADGIPMKLRACLSLPFSTHVCLRIACY